jgi:hypothetical protein
MRKVTFPFLTLIYREYPFTILKTPDDGNKSSIEFILIMPNKLNIGYFIGLFYWKKYEEMCESIKGYEGRRKKHFLNHIQFSQHMILLEPQNIIKKF